MTHQRLLLTLAVALVLLAAHSPHPVSARTLYVDAARVYLPKLRRLLSFGGFLNQQAQDTIVSLDLSVSWKISSPAMTVLPTGLGEATAAMLPHVTRADDGTYTILLYPSQPPAQGKRLKQFRITTKDGKKLDSIVPSDLPESAYAPVFPCFSSTASVLSEQFEDPSIPGDANSYFFGGFPKGTNDTSKVNATEVTAEINLRNSGNLVTALPAGSRNPPRSSACALGYIAPKKIMMQRATAAGTKSVTVLSLLNMQWADYAGEYPDASRRGNQFVPYKSASGRSYVLSVGSNWRLGANNQVLSSIWYSDLDGEKPWVSAQVTKDPEIMYRHGAIVVDDQIVVVGHTDDVSAAQAATAAAVFRIVEPTPGKLEFQWSEEFVPKPGSSPGGVTGGENEATKSGPSMAVVAGGAVAVIVVLAAAGFFVYRRRQSSTAAKPSLDLPTMAPHHPSTPSPAPAAIDAEAAQLDELLFSTPTGTSQQNQQQPWTAMPYQAQDPPAMMSMTTLDYPPALPQPDLMVDPKMQAVLDKKDAEEGAFDGTESQGSAGPAMFKPFP